MLDLYVSGIDQNSDKIFVSAGLLATLQSLDYSTAYYKPIALGTVVVNGVECSKDVAYINFVDPYIKTYNSYVFKEESSPILAAAFENILINENIIVNDFQQIQNHYECLVVDGGTEISSPISKNFLEEDLIKTLNIPLLMVVSAENSIGNTILSINHAKDIGINIRGIVITNFPENPINSDVKLMPKLIEEYTSEKILGILPHIEKNIDPNDLIEHTLNGIDIEAVFNLRIAKLQM